MTVFEYYVQAKSPAMPKHMVPFKVLIAKHAPLVGPIGALQKVRPMTPVMFGQAALDVGYALATPWGSTLLAGPTVVQALGAYLAARLQSVMASVDVVAGEVVSRDFLPLLDSSDMAKLSYLYGQVVARLAANEWLGADPGMAFLHKSVYTDALLTGNALVVVANTHPDYLVSVQTGAWHVFEAKGGRDRGRQIRKGLWQVRGVTSIGTVAVAPPVTKVVASLHVKKKSVPQLPWRIDVVSIPPSAMGAGALDDGEATQVQQAPTELVFDADVAALMAAAAQWAVLSQLPEDPVEMSSMTEQSEGASTRRLMGEDAAVWLPSRAHIDAFLFELLVYLRYREHLRDSPRQALGISDAQTMVDEVVPLIGSAVSGERVTAAVKAVSVSPEGQDSVFALRAASTQLGLAKRHEGILELRNDSQSRVRARLRARALALPDRAIQTDDLPPTACGAVVYVPVR
ncbi:MULTISPECIES: hypothetical protein [unclassified Luteibacter]|uniref:hypothetical protein n=1 Tax=Luteibacter sp. PvP019 TaxID=3156436 RepID=UPI003394884C